MKCFLLLYYVILLRNLSNSFHIYYNWKPEFQVPITGLMKTLYIANNSILLRVEKEDIYLGVKNTIISTQLIAIQRTLTTVVVWHTTDPTLQITSALRLGVPVSLTSAQDDAIFLVCGTSQLNRTTTILEDHQLLFDGMLCSLWSRSRHPYTTWTRIQAGSRLWFWLLTHSVDKGVQFASRLLRNPFSMMVTNARTGTSLIATGSSIISNSEDNQNSAYTYYGTNAWITRFQLYALDSRTNHPAAALNNGAGWLSDKDSDLWFKNPVRILAVFTVDDSPHFYVVFTESDITHAESSIDQKHPHDRRIVTRIGRVCQNDPGQGRTVEFLKTNGLFSTFRKTTLRCFASDVNDSHETFGFPSMRVTNAHKIVSGGKRLLFSRALAFSEPLTISNRQDHMIYALMAPDEDVSGIVGICVFSLNAVNKALNRDRLLSWQPTSASTDASAASTTSTTRALKFTSQNVSIRSEDVYTVLVNGHSGSTLQVVQTTPITHAIANASKQCDSRPLPEYFARYAAHHPFVATVVLAISPRVGSKEGDAISCFTLPINPQHNIRELVTSLTVDWSKTTPSDSDGDLLYIGTNRGSVLAIRTGIALHSFSMTRANTEHFPMSASADQFSISPPLFRQTNKPMRFHYQLTLPNPTAIMKIRLVQPQRTSSANSTASIRNSEMSDSRLLISTQSSVILLSPMEAVCNAYMKYGSDQSYKPIVNGCLSNALYEVNAVSRVASKLEHVNNQLLSPPSPKWYATIHSGLMTFVALVIVCVPIGILFGFILGRRSLRATSVNQNVPTAQPYNHDDSRGKEINNSLVLESPESYEQQLTVDPIRIQLIDGARSCRNPMTTFTRSVARNPIADINRDFCVPWTKSQYTNSFDSLNTFDAISPQCAPSLSNMLPTKNLVLTDPISYAHSNLRLTHKNS